MKSAADVSPTRRKKMLGFFALGGLGLMLGLGACGEEKVSHGPPPPPRRGMAKLKPTASASASATPTVFTEADFTRSETSRDPFRPYFKKKDKPVRVSDLKVVADKYSIDELHLVAIVRGNTVPRAMFVDPHGKGWVVTRGNFVGRSEVVKSAGRGSTEYDVNWKVDRIRQGDVVFVREDPGRPNVAAATRVIALRPEGESKQAVLVH